MAARFHLAIGLLLSVGLLPGRAADVKDHAGDPLPKGALARLGTERMRLLDTNGAPALAPDGKSILLMRSGKITRLDVTTGLPLETLPTTTVGAIAPHVISADGRRGVAITYDSVAVVEIATGKILCDIKRRVFSPEGMVSLSRDGKTLALGVVADDKAKDKGVSVLLWNVGDDKEIASCKVAQNTSARVALSADGRVLATWGAHYEPQKPGTDADPEADPARHVQLWDAATGKSLSTAKFGAPVGAVAVAPDGQTVAAADGVGSIKLFAAKTGELKKQLLGRARIGRIVQFSGDGKAIAATADDGAIQIWDTTTGRSLGVAECPVGTEYIGVRGLAFPTADRLVAFAIRGSEGVVWEAPSGKRLSPAGGHTETPGGLSFTNGDKEILGLSAGGQVIRWDSTGKSLGTYKLRIPGAPLVPAYNSTDRVFAAPNLPMAFRAENTGIGIYDLPSGIQRFSVASEYAYATHVAFSKDGTKLSVVIPPGFSAKAKPGRVVTVDVGKGELSGGYPLPTGLVVGIASTADGGKLAVLRRTVAAGNVPAKLVLGGYDTATEKSLCELPIAEGFGSFFLCPSPAKDRVVLADPREGLVEIDLAEGKTIRNITKGGIALTVAPVYSDDGKSIALSIAGPYDAVLSTIEVRDAESGKLLHRFEGHSRPVTALAFSKDGAMLASASSDTTILVWDLKAGKD